ncbi:glutamine cyclotransferase superfamily [Nitrosococcus oceani AFC27]|uniref:Glutamine cyclotransferase n=1 Tax=Nitrosococcus oceani C-27 TaxID=314279 RepID=A0A0E2ZPM9_9GAMM|nr:glutaminyl-peptide cyclotransferase [Nitrosococcus oceani]EDZ66683.1 glutamine cyclotransferase superfamily [Nitrosococcus oceani AFC27]KFI20317.1 glutamine cyclotransferase [Nitrosococcus oceani C-27]GEM20216.1 glutamine cyclotransferase [Nitrosococcus oceani]
MVRGLALLVLWLVAIEVASKAEYIQPEMVVSRGAHFLELNKTKISGNSASLVYDYQIINSYPHDPEAFTQGLIFDGGFLYESTGKRGRSTLRKVELETGSILQKHSLPTRYFGEGLTLWQDKLIQLTWQRGVGFVYDKKTFGFLYKFFYSTEGWGLTHDDRHLIMSNGSSTLSFLDAETFQQVKQIQVHDNDKFISNLNELEYVKGEIYANVWLTHYIARISPETGQVKGWINLEGLLGEGVSDSSAGVLNGIAYDDKQERLFVTGKYWPKLFEIKLVER